MRSERQKRQEEIEKILREAGESREADVAFQEEVKKTTSAILEKEANRIEQKEQAKRHKRSISPVTAGMWLLVLGALGFMLSMPSLATVFLLCGITVIAWSTLFKPTKSSLLAHQSVKSYKRILKNSLSRLFKKTS
jgi:Flp pilus assembly protein TadB